MKKIFLCSLLLITIFCFTACNNTKATQANELKQIATEYGLEDVSVVFKGKLGDTSLEEVIINCSNFGDLTYDEMFEVNNALEDSMVGIFISSYVCGENTYSVYSSSRSIYKNNRTIYDDFSHSELYTSAKKNKSNSSSNNSETIVTDDEELSACWVLAKDVVKSNLKSPSSAKFPFSYGSDGVSITKSGNTYTVKAWVDADNSFGANIRTNFIVTIESNGYGKNATFTSKSCVFY